jgi:hypothetical protein
LSLQFLWSDNWGCRKRAEVAGVAALASPADAEGEKVENTFHFLFGVDDLYKCSRQLQEQRRHEHRGCQMVYFKTKKSNLVKFVWKKFEMGNVRNVQAISNILRPFGIFYGQLVHSLVVICFCTFPRFGTLYHKKIWQP